MKNKRHLIILLIFVFFFFILTTRTIHAQEMSLSLSPPVTEIFIKPGKTAQQLYKLTNNGNTTVVTARIVIFDKTGIKENPNYTPEPWITVAGSGGITLNKPFTQESNTTMEIVLRVNPPADVIQTDYYRALIFSTIPAPIGNSSQSQITQQIVSPILISVTTTGMVRKTAQILKFDLPTFVDSFGPLNLDIELENTGNVYFRPNGKIMLKSLLSEATYQVRPNVFFINDRKKIYTDLALPDGNALQHTLSLKGFFLGKYEVTADFNLDESAYNLNGKKVFYAIPIKILIVISGIIIFILLIRRRKNKRKELSQPT